MKITRRERTAFWLGWLAGIVLLATLQSCTG